MAYIGNEPGSIRQGRRAVYEFTSTANQTAFSGVDDNGLTLDLLQANDNDVYLNGVRLIITDDYTISGDVLTLVSGAAAGDKLIVMTQDEIANDASYSKAASDSRYINYDGDIVNGTIQIGGSGNNITFADNNKAMFGNDNDLQIYHSGTTSFIRDMGDGDLQLFANDDVFIRGQSTNNYMARFAETGAVTLYHNNASKFSTTSSGIGVTGNATLTSTDSGSSAAPEFELRRDNTGADANYIGQIKFTADNDADQNTVFAKITGKILDASDGTEDGILEFAHKKAGSNVITGRWRSDSLQLLNGTSLTVDGTITGDLTGDTTGTHTGAVTGNVTGNVTGDMDLAAIAKDISDTAVDVFIYDTRKDSDGGAWRKRTQHTSWYNETLSTSTRGSRKEFPAVAVIVAESNQVTIYDGDDPDMPMWMVFNADTSGKMLLGHASLAPISSIAFKNGILSAGAFSSSVGGLTTINFVCDKAYMRRTGSSTYILNTGISGRESSSHGVDTSIGGIVNVAVNDVAMTVLPNAPIDSATGLPVPTIAVATNGGVSVIKDDGTVVNKVTIDAGTYSATVDFTKDGYLIVTRNNYSYFVITYLTEASANHPSGWPYLNYFRSNGVAFPGPNGPANNPHGDQQYGLANRAISLDNNNVASADIYGLNVFNINGGLSSPNNSVAYITSDYNTGWMNGDTRLATLSDTDTANAGGTELVTNGTFNSDVSGWSNNATEILTWNNSGYAQVDRNGGSSQGQCYQNITTEVGKSYIIKVDVLAVSHGFQVYAAQSSIQSSSGSTVANTTGTFYWWFTASATTTRIDLSAVQSSSGTASFDNVSVKLAEADRSVNGKGLQVFGNGITKTPVATGADLVAYGGFTLASYLVQPATSTMINWSNPWISHFWFDTVGKISIESQNSSGYNNTVLLASVNASGLTTRSKVSSGAWDQTVSVANNGWTHAAFVYTGSALEVYRNGIKMATYNGTLSNQTAYIAYGVNSYNGGTFPSSWTADTRLALHRISATVPSAEQIKKIYEDEKFLFQENAKATLYGSSDAVTALAYDDDTELLHVGTSAGRSVFQGLRRIDNTTDAVGAAISASNGMVAED